MQDVTHRFGVPNRIITDLGTAFIGSAFWYFCQDNMIDVYYSLVAHPRCNNQVEHANGMVLQAIKDRIFDDASNYATWWLAELLKDRLGDQRGGSEWESIKVLLQRENLAYALNSQPRIPTQVWQGHVVTADLPT
jgi:hypothetical protein